MKRILKFLIVLSLLIFIGCSNSEKKSGEKITHKIIDVPTYSMGDIIYSHASREPISGLDVNRNRYTLYKNGVVVNEKVVDSDEGFRVISESNYNDGGYLHGDQISRGMVYERYKNGALEAKKGKLYKDGILHGRGYFDGIISNQKVEPKLESESEEFYWDLKIKDDFTGRVHSEFNPLDIIGAKEYSNYTKFQVADYKNGELVAVSLYSEEGYKLSYYEFYPSTTNDNKAVDYKWDRKKVTFLDIEGNELEYIDLKNEGRKVSKYVIYYDGAIEQSETLDENGKKTGRNILDSTWLGSYYEVEYFKGLPHGFVSEYHEEKDGVVEEKYSFYDMGMFTGRELEKVYTSNGEKVEEFKYYIEGIEVNYEEFSNLDISFDDSNIYPKEDIENIEEFTGYLLIKDTNDTTTINHLINGEIDKIIEYNKSEKIELYDYSLLDYDKSVIQGEINITRYNKDDDGYTESRYDGYGHLIRLRTYDSEGVLNGPFVGSSKIGYSNTKTKGEYVDGQIVGDVYHYNSDGEVRAIATYGEDKDFYRVKAYYDYEEDRVEYIQNRYIRESGGWFAVGTTQYFARYGNYLEQEYEYGDELTTDKNITITKYNSDGNIIEQYVTPFR